MIQNPHNQSANQDKELGILPELSIPDDIDNTLYEETVEIKPDYIINRTTNHKRKTRNKSKILITILLVSFSGLFTCAFFIYQMQQQINRISQLLGTTDLQLATISGTLNSNEEKMDNSELKTSSNIDEINSEIRKLWDISYKKNRNKIAELSKQMEETLKTSTVQHKNISDIEAKINMSQQHTNQIEHNMTKLQTIVSDISTDILANNSTSKEDTDLLNESMEAWREKIIISLNELKKTKSNIDNQLTLLTRTNTILDNYKQQTNKRLVQMETTVRQLKNSQPNDDKNLVSHSRKTMQTNPAQKTLSE